MKKLSKYQEKLKDCAQMLEKGVKSIMEGEEYKAFLKFRAKFMHPYSVRNLLLIKVQYPDATMVAGYKKWQQIGRQVKKGEKGIKVYAPTRKKKGEKINESGEKEAVYTSYFVPVPVFALEQTEGEPVPEPVKPKNLAHEAKNVEKLQESLVDFSVSRGLLVDYRELQSKSEGYYRPSTDEIVINSLIGNKTQQLATLIHELAHGMMHKNAKKEDYHIGELEAESTAFLVCDMLGIDTSGYSFVYIADWAKNPSEVLPAIQKACNTADEILNHISKDFRLMPEYITDDDIAAA